VNRDVLEKIRRYIAERRGVGIDVAYLLDKGSSRTDGPGISGSAGLGPLGGTDLGPSGSTAHVTPGSAGPGPRAGEIAVITSPVAMAREPGARRPAEEKPSIRVTRERAVVSQGALFGEPKVESGLDLGGLDLTALERVVSTCERCILSEGRTQTVFGSGNPSAKIVFIGEGPGREEDLQGLPFVGRAGQLLTKILAAMGLARDEVYITNMVKCRPPGNRDPQEDEMRACEPYLARQLELIKPAIICALGRIAGHGLLKKGTSLSALRRGVHYYNDIKVAVTYHPAALLRNPNLKRDAWEDFQMVRRLYDEAIGEGA
jgi:uracil-DNA glycosylase family 4